MKKQKACSSPLYFFNSVKPTVHPCLFPLCPWPCHLGVLKWLSYLRVPRLGVGEWGDEEGPQTTISGWYPVLSWPAAHLLHKHFLSISCLPDTILDGRTQA